MNGVPDAPAFVFVLAPLLVSVALAGAGCAAAGEGGAVVEPVAASAVAAAPSFNVRVLELVAGYPAGGFGGYAWPARAGTSGTTRDLALGVEVIASGGDGNHCVGVTLEVFWRALEQCPGGVAGALDADEARAFKRTWYVPEVGGAGAVEALSRSGLGSRLASLEHARPGDFVQAWRADGLGHSMVLLGWDHDAAGTITGIRYWSSQPWTDGIGEAFTAIGAADDAFDPAHVYVARARCPP